MNNQLTKIPSALKVMLVLVVAVATTTPAVVVTAIEANHVIEFNGMLNGYNNLTKAREILQENLRRITDHEIVIDELEENKAVWHSNNISSKAGCPEQEIRKLYATIKGPNDEFTRKFKMEITEMFDHPSNTFVEWLGPCENIGRKRSQLSGDSSRSGSDGSITSGEVNTSTGTSGSNSINSFASTDATAATPGAGDSSSSSPTPMLPPPTITIEPPTSTPALAVTEANEDENMLTEKDDTTSTTDQTDADDITTPSIPDLGAMFTSGITIQTNTETTTTVVTTVTTEIAASDPSTTSATTRPAQGEADTIGPERGEGDSANTNTEMFPPPSTLPPPPEVVDSNTGSPEAAAGINLTPTTTATHSSKQEHTKASEDAVNANSTQYGKYIGLSVAFLIFVAYLVCSRAYKRQGMYELHRE